MRNAKAGLEMLASLDMPCLNFLFALKRVQNVHDAVGASNATGGVNDAAVVGWLKDCRSRVLHRLVLTANGEGV
ncbi:hypothetical protein [Azospirillum cavernae]|uniref:hypothetical protein n=1 Tax=Azospirillum cavernae TaxID=2320860 RepID=UPI0011C49135|nr:hypothetical protein [Azospirillum cavernae]